MTITHRIARSCLAPVFIASGIDAIRRPDGKTPSTDPVTTWISGALGITDDAASVVRVNGAVQLVAGSLLMVGRLPRLAAMALSTSLVPSTIAGHPYWNEHEPAKRAQQRTQLLKNTAMLGGLVLAATDTDGAPSLRWRAKRAARHTQERAAGVVSNATHSTPSLLESGRATLSHLGELASETATVIAEHAERAAETGMSKATVGLSKAAQLSSSLGDSVAHAGGALADRVR